MLSFSDVALALGRGLRVDRCQRKYLTEGEALAAGVKVWGGHGMWWGLDDGPGNGLWGLCLDIWLGLGMHDVVA